MKLDYGTQLSPIPITLSIGTLRKPTLREISELTFDKFSYYETLLKVTPKEFYTKIKKDEGKVFWDSLTKEEKEKMTLFDVIKLDIKFRELFLEILNFFFVEFVTYISDGFEYEFIVVLNQEITNPEDITQDNIKGVISQDNFLQIIDLIQQICCINNKEEAVDETMFKNSLAKEIYEKTLKAKKEEQEKNKARKIDINLSLPNIISAVSSNHPSINLINVWDLTLFQLLDKFNRLQANMVFKIDSTRVSVWGDEKKSFDISLWYKNEYDKKLS